MADLVVPQLGESISEAVVSKWLKNIGDAVTVDEPIAELETDKITVQLPSPVAGALGEQRAAVGATAKVGQVTGEVSGGAKTSTSSLTASATSTSTSTATSAKPARAPAPAPAPQTQAQSMPESKSSG